MLEFLFWLFLLLAAYSYFIYPLCLIALNASQKDDANTARGSAPQSITIIVTAYNEENRIRSKIENTLAIDIPVDDFEIVVASDCSDDDTDSIVNEYAARGVKLVRASERLGKENAQWTAIQQAQGEILVFSDVATQIPQDALQKLLAYFANPIVGAVSSEDRFMSKDGGVAGEGAYVKYEMWLRKQESQLAGLVGLSGSFFAARKSVCQQWDIHSPSDFNTALNCAQAGLKAVTAPDVLGYYEDLKDASKEYARKIRTVIRGMTALQRHPTVLNPMQFKLFAFQVISHKLMRWLVPWFLLGLFILSALLATDGIIYALALIGQLAFYGLAIAAHYGSALLRNNLIKIIYFFVQVNVAIFDASCRFLSGVRMTTWKPSAR